MPSVLFDFGIGKSESKTTRGLSNIARAVRNTAQIASNEIKRMPNLAQKLLSDRDVSLFQQRSQKIQDSNNAVIKATAAATPNPVLQQALEKQAAAAKNLADITEKYTAKVTDSKNKVIAYNKTLTDQKKQMADLAKQIEAMGDKDSKSKTKLLAQQKELTASYEATKVSRQTAASQVEALGNKETNSALKAAQAQKDQAQSYAESLQAVQTEYLKLSQDNKKSPKGLRVAQAQANVEVKKFEAELIKAKGQLVAAAKSGNFKSVTKARQDVEELTQGLEDAKVKAAAVPQVYAAAIKGKALAPEDVTVTKPIDVATEKLGKLSDALYTYNGWLDKVGESAKEGGGFLGDLVSGLDTAFGTEGLSGSVGALVEQTQSLVGVYADYGDTIKEVVGKIFFKTAAEGAAAAATVAEGTAATAATPVLLGAAAGTGGLAAAAGGLMVTLGPILLIAIPLAVAFLAIKTALDKNAEAAKKAKEALEEEATAKQQQYADDVDLQRLILQAKNGNKQAQSQLIQDLVDANNEVAKAGQARSTYLDEATNKQSQIDDLNQQSADKMGQYYEEINSNASNFFSSTTDDTARTLSGNAQKIKDSLDALRKSAVEDGGAEKVYADSTAKLKTLTDAMAKLGYKLTPEQVHALSLAYEQGDLAAQQYLDSIQGINDVYTSDDVKQAKSDLAQLYMETDQMVADHAKQVSDALEESQFQRSRELEDRQRADDQSLRDHVEGMQGMIDDYNESEEEAYNEHRKEMAKSQIDFDKQEAKAAEDLQKELTKAEIQFAKDQAKSEASYQEEQAKSQEQHFKELKKAQDDYDFERLRRLEDLNDQLFGLELANDVLGYIQAQAAGEKEDRRAKEDFDKSQAESQQQYEESRAESAKQHAQDMADAKQQYEEQRAESIQQAAEQKAERAQQYAEQIADAEAAYAEQRQKAKESLDKQLADTEDAFNKQRAREKEERDFQDARRIQDLKRAFDQQEQSFKDELDAQKKKEADLLYIVNNEGQKRLNTEASWMDKSISTFETKWAAHIARINAMNFASTGGSNLKPSNAFTGSKSNIGGAFGGGLSGGSTGKGLGGFGKVFAAAKGTVVDKPTLLIAGEGKQPEAVLPLDRTKGLPPGLMGNSAPSVSIRIDSLVFGGNSISRAEVEDYFIRLEQTLVDVVVESVG